VEKANTARIAVENRLKVMKLQRPSSKNKGSKSQSNMEYRLERLEKLLEEAHHVSING
jgi:hypothetical protein